MSYKDLELERRYQREWRRRKRAGLPTALGWRTKPKKTPEERRVWKIKYNKEYKKRERERKETLVREVLGAICCICGRPSGMPFATHRRDGSSHEKLNIMPYKKFEKEIKSGRYVRVCYACHKSVHWIMKYFMMTWEEIIMKIELRK